MPDVMAWLRGGVPLTLAIDLLDPSGPASQRILSTERPSDESLAWLKDALARWQAEPSATS